MGFSIVFIDMKTWRQVKATVGDRLLALFRGCAMLQSGALQPINLQV